MLTESTSVVLLRDRVEATIRASRSTDCASNNDRRHHEEPLDTHPLQVCPVLLRTDLPPSHVFLHAIDTEPASSRMALRRLKHALATDPDMGPGEISATRCPRRRESFAHGLTTRERLENADGACQMFVEMLITGPPMGHSVRGGLLHSTT
jgi:hypothetical protein